MCSCFGAYLSSPKNEQFVYYPDNDNSVRYTVTMHSEDGVGHFLKNCGNEVARS